jgi:hypothetical protein
MTLTLRLVHGLAVFSIAAWAQSVDIFSEFHRLDPFGTVVPADRGAVTREILSPGVARNAWASFHVAISVPAKESYLLYVATNPVTACRVDLYREHFVKAGDGWVPDKLVPVERLPDFGAMPDPDDGIEGQTTRLYLLDLWIPPDADVARFRLEVQLKVGDWTIRPMEVRVLPARVPDIPPTPEGAVPKLPPVEAGADSAALSAFAGYLAGVRPQSFGRPKTLVELIRRNAVQDMALGRTIQPWGEGPESLARTALVLSLFPRIVGSEWYLRVRDYVYSRIRF